MDTGNDESDKKKEVAAMLRAVIQSSKGGVHINNLNKEYMMLVGESVPFRNLGYGSLRELLNSMPNVVRIRRNHEGDEVVQAVADENTAHIASLVARQKSAKPKLTARKPIRKPNPRPHPWYPPNRSYGPTPSPGWTGAHRGKPHPSTYSNTVGPAYHPKRTPKPAYSPKQQVSPQSSLKASHNYQVPPRFQKIRETPATPAPYHAFETLSPTPPTVGSFRGILKAYAKEKGVELSFCTVAVPETKPNRPERFLSSVKILEQTFSSFPADKYTKEEAEEEVARKAVAALKIGQDGAEQPIPTSRYETAEERQRMLDRIREIVAPHEKGLWSHQVPIEYTSRFGESLPEEWLQVVGTHCGNIEITPVQGSKCILYHKERKKSISYESPDSSSEGLDPDSSINGIDLNDGSEASSLDSLPEALELPDKPHWDLFVSYVISTVCVVVRFIDHSEKYDELTNEMDLYYSSNQHPLSEVVVGGLYAVKADGAWHRVQVISTYDNKAECYYVDHGDTDVLPYSQLHELQAKFLSVPFQAFECQLLGLEDHSENHAIEQPLLELLGKSFVAEVASKEIRPFPVVLYDTSTDDDVNVNQRLLDIASKVPIEPVLPKVSGIASVSLTHVTSNGEIYVQIEGPHKKHLNRLHNELATSCEASNKPVHKPVPNKIYAVKYDDGGWYRAVLTEQQPIKPDKFQFFFIDYGNTSTVSPEYIREAEILDKPKVNMAPQAVKCCLYGVPPDQNLQWTEQATQKLNAMAPEQLTLLLKVVRAPSGDNPAQVELFKRIEPHDELVSINQTLALNADLFRLILKKDGSEKMAKAVRRTPSSQRSGSSRHTPEPIEARQDSLTLSNSSQSTPEANSPVPESPKANTASLSLPLNEDKKDLKSMIAFAMASPDGISEGSESTSCLPTIEPPNVPDIGGDFDIHVTLAANPNNFVCQPWATGKNLDQLMEDMQAFYSSEENIFDFPECLVEEGSFYACKHQVDDSWYRVYVQSIVSREPFMVSAYFVDYGDFVMVELSALQPLWRKFRSLPFQAIRAGLAGIEAAGGDWSPTDCVQFQKLVVDKQFVAIVKGKKTDTMTENIGGVHLDLVLVDTTDPKEDIFVSNVLVEMGLAKLTSSQT